MLPGGESDIIAASSALSKGQWLAPMNECSLRSRGDIPQSRTLGSGQQLGHGDPADFIPGEHDGDVVVL